MVFANAVVLLVGLWVTFAIRQLARDNGPSVLRHLFHYSACFNGLVFLWLVGLYSATNVFAGDKAVVHPELAIPLILGSFVVETGLAYSLLQMVSRLKERGVGPLERRVLGVGVVLFGISFVIGATILVQSGSGRWFITTKIALMETGCLWIVVQLARLLRSSGTDPDPAQAKAARAFALLLLPGYLVLLTVVALPLELHLVLSILNPLWLNLAPLIWLRRHWPRPTPGRRPSDLGAVLASLGQTRKITRRELEIMELILAGKSNKEIEQQLCISFNTVKNHIYNLYRKLNVSSRGQLVSLVLREQERRLV